MDTERRVSISAVKKAPALGSFVLLFLLVSGAATPSVLSQQPPADVTSVPDAPQPQTAPAQPQQRPGSSEPAGLCDLRNLGATIAATAAVRAYNVTEAGPQGLIAPPRIVGVSVCVPHMPIINWYARFLNGPQVKAMTPLQKAHLAGRDLVDPANIATIAGLSAISTASNSHTAVGPGFRGWANDIGVSFTQDMVGEFFGTFLIPSFTHQDPHYHRMPTASIGRRAIHAVAQIGWTQGDNGKGMVNYADLVGFAAEVEVNNLYVPGQETNLPASAARYGLTLATAPIDNFITEFLPDIASHIHVRVVLVQRIINQVARTDANSAP